MIKGVSPIIGFVIVIALVFVIAALISPWAFNIAMNATNQTGTTVMNKIICQNSGYDFDTNYGTNGVNWNFTGSDDWLKSKVVNTGTVNLYDFSFEIEINSTIIKYYNVNSTTQKTKASPLKPGQSVILHAALTDDINGTLTKIKILNEACPSIYIEQDI